MARKVWRNGERNKFWMGTFSFLRMHVPAYVYVCVCVCTVSVCTWMGLRLGEFSDSPGSMEEEIHRQLFSA